MSQKEIFLQGEGDAWFRRNLNFAHQDKMTNEPILKSLQELSIRPGRILEIGCSTGHRLAAIADVLHSTCYGIDPSAAAIEQGRNLYPHLHLQQGTADDLPYDPNFFDLIIFGFCLYLCDPTDHFKIAWQADQALADKGFILIKDFSPARSYRNSYSHKDSVYSYKMEFSRMFSWHPAYSLVSRAYLEHAETFTFEQNECICIDLLRKDVKQAFPTLNR